MTKIKKNHFTGLSHVFTQQPNGLSSLLRDMVVGHNLMVVQHLIQSTGVAALDSANFAAWAAANPNLSVAGITFTDNSTGTPGSSVVDLPTPAAGTTIASGATGAAVAALNTALGKTENALKVIGTLVNLVRAPIGLPALTMAVGTVATPGTIPAQDLDTSTGANGTSAADRTSAVAAFKVAQFNLDNLVRGINETLVALGLTPVPAASHTHSTPAGLLFLSQEAADLAVSTDIPTVTAAAAGGLNALLKTDADAVLAALANNIATIAALWNTEKALIVAKKPSIILSLT